MRRIVLVILALLCAVPSGTPLCASATASEGEKELIVWGAWRRRGLDAAFRRFEQEHPGWRIVTSTAAGAGQMDPQKLMCAIAGGSPPDVLIQDRFSVGEWALRDAFLSLDDRIQRSLDQERMAVTVREALRRSDAAAAQAALQLLIGELERLGASAQLSLAYSIADALKQGAIGDESQQVAEKLARLCQGIHPDRFYDACWQEATFETDGVRRVYAIPNTTDARALYYNLDLLERAGLVDEQGRARPPRNWDELREYAQRLTERDRQGTLQRVGFVPMYGNSWLYLYGWQNGGRFMSEDGRRCTLDNPRIIDALQYIVQMYDMLGGVERVQSFQSTFQAGELDPFITGKVAMKIDSDYFQNTIAAYAPNMRFGVAPAPPPEGQQPITWSGGFSWVIPAGAEHPEMAFELIRFLMTDRVWELRNEVEEGYASSRGRGFIPDMAPLPHVNQMTYDRFLRDAPDLPVRFKEHFLLFSDLMKVSRFRPVTPVGQLLWDEHVRACEKALRQTYSPAEALRRGTRAVQDQLDLAWSDQEAPKISINYPLWLVGGLSLGAIATMGVWARRRGRHRHDRYRDAFWGYCFVSPWLIGFIVLTAGPVIASIIYSFSRYDVLHDPTFIGADNYRRLMSDPTFWRALGNTGFMMIGVPLGMAVGLGIAMLLNMDVPGMRAYRTIFYLPAIVPVVASSLLWIWVLNPELGLINSFLRMLGWSNPPLWLNSSSWIFGSKTALLLMGLWSAGASMIIWLAGLKGIPRHLYEAAEIDGAGPMRRFGNVTLPMLSPYIFFNLVMGVIGTMQIFSQAYIMTQGGPDDSTLFYAYYLFNAAFRYFNMGYASAMAWILFLIVLALTLLQMWIGRRWVHYETA